MNEDRVVDTLPSRIWHRDLPVPLLFVVGGCSLNLGAALAVMLFDRLSPAAVAWLRMLVAALILLAWRRPDRAVWRGQRLVLVACFGLVTGLMNVAFYEAIARLPLGTAVAVEFCGPVVVAAWGSRSVRDVAALMLAATGVDDITVGFTLAAVLLCPLALGTGPAWGSPTLLAMAAGVGVLSTALPYALDQVVLRRVGQARFALLLALLPAAASVVGLLVLGQLPHPLEAAGIVAVAGAVALSGSTAPGSR